MNNLTIHELGNLLLAKPDIQSTDYSEVKQLESEIPNIMNAWTHVVPDLADFAKKEGKVSFLGKNKGSMAFEKLSKNLRIVVLALYGDHHLTIGESTDKCLYHLVESLVLFKSVYPNWKDAYTMGFNLFVTRSESIKPILGTHQKSVETELYNF